MTTILTRGADGLPHWRLYQSRVLGPYMVKAVSKITGWSFAGAYGLMMWVWLVIFFAALISAAVAIWKSALIAIGIAASAAFLNSTLMQGGWLYPWDYIDLTIFTALIWAILTRKSILVIAVIVLIEMFNRESAAIIAGWLALDALLDLTLRRAGASSERSRSAKRQLIVSVALGVATLITVETLRSTLLVREIGPEIFHGAEAPGRFFALTLFTNIDFYISAFSHLTSLTLIYNVLIAAILIICILGTRSSDREVGRISLFFLILWGFTFTFGVSFETRVWLGFVPYLVLVVPRLLTMPTAVQNAATNASSE